MSIALIDDDAGAIPIRPLSKADLPAWLEQNPPHAAWVKANGFTGEAGSFVLLPGPTANLSARPGRPEGGEATGLRALYSYRRGLYA